MNIKKIGKNFICQILEWQAKRLIAKNQLSIIAVGGSIGKTSTKLAIAKSMSAWTKVIYQEGNYNDRLTVPLVLFAQTEPNIFNIFKWFWIVLNNEKTIRKVYQYNYAVLEIGTDGPGQLKDFAYLKPRLYVLTAIAEEHMVYFKSLDNVASEELVPVSFSEQTLVNLNNLNPKYLTNLEVLTYGSSPTADYSYTRNDDQLLVKFRVEDKTLTFKPKLIGEQGAVISLAATSVNHILGHASREVLKALENLEPIPGRMQLLEGIKGSLLIDDTYNASPSSTKSALDVLYSYKQKPKKIAILGSMNELGSFSQATHQQIGAYCDPNKLQLLVTVGLEAKDYLAPVALAKGCQVKSFLNPIEAGNLVKDLVNKDTIVLVKGSQNHVFCEEALKPLLFNPSDSIKLVRQSAYWLKIKQKQFKLSLV